MDVRLEKLDIDGAAFRELLGGYCANPIVVILKKYWILVTRDYHGRFFLVTPDGTLFKAYSNLSFENSESPLNAFRALLFKWGQGADVSIPATTELYSIWCSARGDLRRSTVVFDQNKRGWVNAYV